MRFYTNVQMVGDNFLVRGYEDGKHFATREKFYPTLFVDTKKKSKYKTLTGDPVEAIEPGTVRESRDFIKRYNEVENFNIYGNERFIYQYISEKYPEQELKFDIEKIKLVTLDIEVKSEQGFPDVESAAEEILLISIQDYTTKQIRTWGLGPFNNKQDNVIYILLLIFKWSLPPSNYFLCAVILYGYKKYLFSTRFYIRESLLRLNLNIKGN